MKRKAFFFDRDGIVNVRIMGGYVTRVEEFVFLPDFFEVFRRVKEAGYLAVLITNQQGVGKGIMSEQALHDVHEYMQSGLVRATGFSFDDIFYCPDLASVEYSCRKPSPRMLLNAAERHTIDIEQSWMLGDTLSDARAARAAGVGAILIGDFDSEEGATADHVFPSLGAFLIAMERVLFGAAHDTQKQDGVL